MSQLPAHHSAVPTGGASAVPPPILPDPPAPTAPTAPEAAAASEHRRAPRTNMFIAAVADLEGRSVAARIRNMSQTGALIELSEPVRKGVRLTVRRGEQAAAGGVVWSSGYRCGVAFSDMVCVSTWMGRPVARDGEGQKRVDAIQAQIRGGTAFAAPVETARAAVTAQLLQQRLSEELVHLKQVIDTVGEALAGEPAVLDHHAEAMQQFDIVSQTLGHLARVLIAPDPVEALGGIGMDSLRRRLSHGEG
jgi:hypothetical protein